ncbi:MAG: hypothetical protein VST67_01000, partial [Nitrospirota bacterium]|nr:hypothetical protein [Nitrospirota bacterium]
MKALSLFYATNRRHEGKDRFRPEGYGAKFSDDGSENLRFGKLTLQADEQKINEFLNAPVGDGVGNGNDLADYLTSRASSAKIQAYRERINPEFADINQPNKQLGSIAMFNELRGYMRKHTDVLVYIHGYNVSWAGAVGAALSLQEMLNQSQNR